MLIGCPHRIDYLKLDAKGNTKESWARFRKGISACPRPIFLQVAFCRAVGCLAAGYANSWRTSGDVQATWQSLMGNTKETEPLWPLVRLNSSFGGQYNDPGTWAPLLAQSSPA